MTRTATATEAAPLTAPPAPNGTAPSAAQRRTTRPNRVELTGRLKTTPNLRYTKQGGVPVADVVLITNEQSAQEVPVIAWREIAEYAAELEPDTALQVIGRIVIRTYQPDEGEERSYLEIAAIQLLPVHVSVQQHPDSQADPIA